MSEKERKMLAIAVGRLCPYDDGPEHRCGIYLTNRDVKVISLDTDETLHHVALERVQKLELCSSEPKEKKHKTSAELVRDEAEAKKKPFAWLRDSWDFITVHERIKNVGPTHLKLQYADPTGRTVVVFFREPDPCGITKAFDKIKQHP